MKNGKLISFLIYRSIFLIYYSIFLIFIFQNVPNFQKIKTVLTDF
jgi:hypothetical protein